ncbi:Uncharacterised protein [Mycobacteroides abscessus subsp. abscessus]|nr:Uncharacterised protein [Mycobacteroides abscessus subsp. abscessus]
MHEELCRRALHMEPTRQIGAQRRNEFTGRAGQRKRLQIPSPEQLAYFEIQSDGGAQTQRRDVISPL